MTTDITTDINLQSIGRIALQAVYTGSPDGELKLQAANNIASPTWIDIPDSPFVVSGAGTFMWNLEGSSYSALRVVYTYASGSGTLEVFATAKGL